jgi:exopolyphosphatase/guanosine-5'-triphosphate,3'-diphosphate pyrophosphatase
MGDREREWLEYGALLHDVGMHISYEGHHRHSYYLIRNGGLRGMTPDETEVIALVTRYHRRGRPRRSHEGYGRLPRASRRAVRLLAACVRLAEGLDRSHSQVIRDLDVVVDADECLVRLHAVGDAELELWAGQRQAKPLGRVLGRSVRLDVIPLDVLPSRLRNRRETRTR